MSPRAYPEPGSVDVLLVAYGGGHVAMVEPVAQELARRGVRVCVLALTTAMLALEGGDLPHFTYADLPQADLPDRRRLGRELAGSLSGPQALPREETEAYLGVNFADMVHALGAGEARHRWRDGGRQHFDPRRTMTEMLTDIRPRMVVATNSPRSERAAVGAAGALGIPAAVIVDMFALREVEWLADPSFGDRLYVLDESVKRMFVERGRPAADILVSRNPAFDALHDPDVREAGRALRAERGWGRDGRRVVLYASSPEPERHPFTDQRGDPSLPGRIERRLRRMVDGPPALDLVIRRHPSEPQDVASGPHVHVSTRSERVEVVLHAVDAAVVTCSTVGLQAYLVGLPVVNVQGSMFNADAPFDLFGMAVAADTLDGIPSALDDAFRAAKDRREVTPASTATATRTICDDLLARLASLEGGDGATAR